MEGLIQPYDDQMLYVSFNQDSSCFAIGTDRGFKIYKTFPFKDKFERVLEGGIGIVEMLFCTNILALVGGGKCPKYNKNKVIIWDDFQTKVMTELKFTTSVKNIKLKRDKIIVVCEKRIFVFNLQTYQNLDIIDTGENPKGLIAINQSSDITIIAYPSNAEKTGVKGGINIKNYSNDKEVPVNTGFDSSISYLSINNDGKLLAAASDKGTIIKIFSCTDGACLQEFRRGKEKAEISYICFDRETKLMAATSDRGTIHIWSMGSVLKKVYEEEEKEKEDLPKNQSSIFRKVFGGVFFQSEWSFAQVRINEQKSICTFGPDNTIIAISSDGKYYQAKIDLKKGGDCKIIKEVSLNEVQK